MEQTVLDLTHLLEPVETFEAELGVYFDALYAEVYGEVDYIPSKGNEPCFRINGEIHARDGTALARHIKIVADGYNESGCLVCTNYEFVHAKRFYGFETFTLFLGGVPVQDIKRIRIYPKLFL